MKILRTALIALVLLILAAVAAIYILSEWALRSAPPPTRLALEAPTPAQLADGARQLRVLGCISCHGDKLEGQPFFEDASIAKLDAPNLTLLAAKATDAQLDQAIRGGVGTDGRALLVMPSEGYQFLTGAEAAALIAAIRAAPRFGTERPARQLGPLGRFGLATGKFRHAPALVDEYRASPLPRLGSEIERGRHIVEVNCSECHGTNLRGKEVKPGTVSADLTIAGAYDLPAFTKLLREGVAPGKKLGLMGEVSRSDFKHLTDEEIAAVHAYLTSWANRSTDQP